jgi:hypothetical protein
MRIDIEKKLTIPLEKDYTKKTIISVNDLLCFLSDIQDMDDNAKVEIDYDYGGADNSNRSVKLIYRRMEGSSDLDDHLAND